MRKMERTFIALLWAISRSGLEKLTLSVFGKKEEIPVTFQGEEEDRYSNL